MLLCSVVSHFAWSLSLSAERANWWSWIKHCFKNLTVYISMQDDKEVKVTLYLWRFALTLGAPPNQKHWVHLICKKRNVNPFICSSNKKNQKGCGHLLEHISLRVCCPPLWRSSPCNAGISINLWYLRIQSDIISRRKPPWFDTKPNTQRVSPMPRSHNQSEDVPFSSWCPHFLQVGSSVKTCFACYNFRYLSQ